MLGEGRGLVMIEDLPDDSEKKLQSLSHLSYCGNKLRKESESNFEDARIGRSGLGQR
jgi:hypothetical protein